MTLRAALCLVLACVPRLVRADHVRDIVVEVPGERSTTNLAVLGGVAGAGLVAGAVGVYFHLDSRSQSDAISAPAATGKPWTSADQAKLDRASSDRTAAAVAYGIGGGLLLGAVIAWIATEPESERTIIHPHTAVAPTPGGAMIAHWWRF
jgi:hypothetical protein